MVTLKKVWSSRYYNLSRLHNLLITRQIVSCGTIDSALKMKSLFLFLYLNDSLLILPTHLVFLLFSYMFVRIIVMQNAWSNDNDKGIVIATDYFN